VANLRDIRKRIASVKDTQKITRAMKMVSAAKLRRAQDNILKLRPYAIKTAEVLGAVAARVEEQEHPLLRRRDPKRVFILVLTSDKGLCGSFNTNINRRAEDFLAEHEGKGGKVQLAVVGKKGRNYFRHREVPIAMEFMDVFESLDFDKAGEIARTIMTAYEKGDLDATYLCYNEFKSAMRQEVVVEPLLPIVPREIPPEWVGSELIFEPDQTTLLDRLLPMYVEIEVFRALLESVASEHGARMTAMENATNNAADMIKSLTLVYNKARQAAITKELMDIVGGTEALKGA
jgi:F-type H+-transporting ATPase subunit gamma